jgi:hypothetical protein
MGRPPPYVTARDRIKSLGQRSSQGARGSGLGRPQLFFDFADAVLHGVEVRRVGGQITDAGAGSSDGGNRLGSGGKLDVVYLDLLARAQTGDQELLDVAGEDCGVNRSFNQKRGTEPGLPHGTNDREVGSLLKGLGHHRPLAARGACVSPCHG